MKLRYILTVAAVVGSIHASAISQAEVRWHNESNDTIVITRWLVDVSRTQPTPGAAMLAFAEKMTGLPYQGGTLEGEPERLTVNIDAFDCTTLVETAAALTRTLNEGRTSWRDFIYNLEQLRYRGGEVDGYASRLHYFSEWIMDNVHRGNIIEVTDRIGAQVSKQIKTLDFMSTHRDKYPALNDSANYEALKSVEIGYRSHRIPYIRTADLNKAQLRDGDIVAITTAMKNLDVTHVGIIKLINGVPHLVHASSKAGKVIDDPVTLADYLRHRRDATGIRVVRLKD